jgi:methylase of polypeptide subunit release factors
VTQNAANPGSPLSDAGTVDRLGADLRAAGYDSDGVPAVLGMGAHRALGRGELAPALRATRDRSPLATLTRLFLLGSVEDEVAVGRALPRTGIAEAIDQGVLERSGGAIRAALDIRPYSADAQEFLLVSDLDSDTRPGPVRRDHVLGIGAASVTLARAVIREPVDRALDVGTGSGVQALHLASHAREVVATDVNPRALALAAATARLNGQHWDLRAGSMYEPVAGEDFDLIVCNPPFVIGDGEMRYSYRDSGVAGDGICRALVEGVRTHLRPGGTAQLLANWIVREGADWRDRVGSWVQASGCDAWVVQRELADPAEYVGLWLTDAGEDGKATGADPAAATALAENWLDYLADEEVTGQEAAGFLRRRGWVERATDADLLASRLVLSGQVILERRSLAGDDGWTTVLRMVRRPGGPGATLELDEWGQALLAGCRGAAPLRLLIELLAAANGLNTDALADAALPAVRAAVIRGLLEPVTA